MTQNHTPGPWAIRLEGRKEQEIIVRSTAQVPDEFDGKPHEPLIADLYRGGKGNIHDARLIAAAPELLEALELCINAMFPGCPDEEWSIAYEKAIATIAKATNQPKE